MHQAQTIETDRCRLKALTRHDKNDIWKLYNNEKVREFLGGTTTADEFDAKFENDILNSNILTLIVTMKENQNFIGLITIDKHHDEQHHEISYQFLPEFWGAGLAHETLNAVMEYATVTIGLTSIIAETQSANLSSTKLLNKLGMKPIKTLERFGHEQIIFQKALSHQTNAA